MTLLDEPPVTTAPSTTVESVRGSVVPAWRFAARLARREVRRRPGRTALAALLIAVPVAAMTLGSVLARTNAVDWAADFERDYGDADLVVGAEGYDMGFAGTGAPGRVPDGGVVTGEYVRTPTSITPVDGDRTGTVWVDFSTIDFEVPAESVGIEITAGRAPTAGEMLLDPEIAELLGVRVGDRLELERPAGGWTVAGFGRMRGDYWRDPVIVPGFDIDRITADQRQTTTLIEMPDGTPVAQIRRLAAERGAITRYDDPVGGIDQIAPGMAWGFVAGVLALVAVGIIVAAAFATSARRQLVTIGQLSANGAPQPVLRRTLALQGTWTGVVGAVVGVGTGLALLPVAAPLVERHLVRHELRSFRFSVIDLVVIALTAIVAATVAAAVPARSASGVPVMAALAGRRPVGTPPAWLVPTGLVLFGGGLGLVAVAALGAEGSNGANNTWAAMVVLGATGMVFGMCCASPLVVERVGRLGRRTSLSWRVALRSLARSRTRSAAVVAAIAVAAGGAVAISSVLESALRSSQLCCPPTVPADAVIAWTYHAASTSDDGTIVDLGPLTDVSLPTDVSATVASVFPEAEVAPLLTATFDPEAFDQRDDWIEPAGPRIASDAVLDLIGLSNTDRDRLRTVGALQPMAGGQYATSDGEQLFEGGQDGQDGQDGQYSIDYRTETGTISVPFVLSERPSRYDWEGQLLMTPVAARAAGFSIVQTGVIVRNGSPLTPAQIGALSELQQRLFGSFQDAFVEPGDPPATMTGQLADAGDEYTNIQYDDPGYRTGYHDDIWIARLVVVAVALLLTLLVVSIGLALAAAEGRDERDTFAVMGAAPSTMRRQAAARAVVMAMTGIVLGIPLGFAPVWVFDRITNSADDPYTAPVEFPVLVVAALFVLVPVLVAVAAWGGSGIAQRVRPASPTHRD